MTVILVCAMFVTFFVVESFTHKPAPAYGEQSAIGDEAMAPAAQRVEAGREALEPPLPIRTGTDRRRADRRGRGSESAA